MKITPVKTSVLAPRQDLFRFLDRHLRRFPERSILAVTSKIVALSEGRVAPVEGTDKDALIRKEAEYFLPRGRSRYNVMLTIKDGILAPAAGIDESNGNGFYILWPKNSVRSANAVRAYLKKRFKVKEAGVIVTDSRTTPLRIGTTGVALAISGFEGVNDHIGRPDIFGRAMTMTKVNVMDALSSAAVVAMGETDERMPLALIEEVPFVKFTRQGQTSRGQRGLIMNKRDDLYMPLLKSAKWRNGKS